MGELNRLQAKVNSIINGNSGSHRFMTTEREIAFIERGKKRRYCEVAGGASEFYQREAKRRHEE